MRTTQDMLHVALSACKLLSEHGAQEARGKEAMISTPLRCAMLEFAVFANYLTGSSNS